MLGEVKIMLQFLNPPVALNVCVCVCCIFFFFFFGAVLRMDVLMW